MMMAAYQLVLVKLPKWAFWCVLYILARPLFDYCEPHLFLPGLGPMNLYTLQRQSLFLFTGYTLVIVLGLHTTSVVSSRFLIGLGLINAVLVCFGQGLLGNPGQDGAFIALTLPLMAREKFYGLMIPALIGIMLSKSATAFLATFVIGALYVHYMIFLPAILGALCLWSFLPDFWADNGRLFYWQQALELSLSQMPVLGLGPGSYFVYGAAMNQRLGHMSVPVWTHNDFVEVTFGYGILGLCILLFLLVMAWRSARGSKEFTSLLGGFIVVMCFQMPLSQPFFWLFIIYFIGRVSEREDLCLQKP